MDKLIAVLKRERDGKHFALWISESPAWDCKKRCDFCYYCDSDKGSEEAIFCGRLQDVMDVGDPGTSTLYFKEVDDDLRAYLR